jgi:hypothetical protein
MADMPKMQEHFSAGARTAVAPKSEASIFWSPAISAGANVEYLCATLG